MDLLAYECKVSSEITYLLPIPIVKRIVDIFERSLPFMNKKKALPYVSTLKKVRKIYLQRGLKILVSEKERFFLWKLIDFLWIFGMEINSTESTRTIRENNRQRT